jgi:uncharacterized membrane protein
MKMHRYFIVSILVLAVQLIIVLWLGYSLPADAKLPVHWNIKNQIDGWASRNIALFPFWLFNIALFLLLMFSRQLSPVFRQNRERYDSIIPLMTLGLVSFFAMFHIYIMLLGHHPEWSGKIQIVFILIGALFIFLGNILPKVPRNYIAGIKTPWTFYSDEIWRRTSRLGGWCFVLMGLAMLTRGVFNISAIWMNVLLIVLLAVLIIVPIAYSFILFRLGKREEE